MAKNNQELIEKRDALSAKIRKTVSITIDHTAFGGKTRLCVSDLQNDPSKWVNIYENDTEAMEAAYVIRKNYEKQGRVITFSFK